MKVVVKAWKRGEKTSFSTGTIRNTEDAMTQAIAACWRLLEDATGEYTEATELRSHKINRIEITFHETEKKTRSRT